jgi:hypothetical protein
MRRRGLLRCPLRLDLLLVRFGMRQGQRRKSDLRHGLHGQHDMPFRLPVLCAADRRRQCLPRQRARNRPDVQLPDRTHLLRLGMLCQRLDLLSGFDRDSRMRPTLHRQHLLPSRLAVLLSAEQRAKRVHRGRTRSRSAVPVLGRRRLHERLLRPRDRQEWQPDRSLRVQNERRTALRLLQRRGELHRQLKQLLRERLAGQRILR